MTSGDEVFIEELGMTRGQLKILIATRSSFEVMPVMDTYAEICARRSGLPTTDIVDIARGNPPDDYLRPTYEGIQLCNLLGEAVNEAHNDGNGFLHSLELGRIWNNLKTKGYPEGRVETAAQNLERVLDFLVEAAGARDEDKEDLRSRLIREFVRNKESISYASTWGLEMTQILFKVLLEGASEGLERRVLEPGEEFPHRNKVLIVQGVSQGINTYFNSGYCKPGDKAIIITPFYAPYETLARRHGVGLIPIPTNTLGALDLEAMERLFRDIKRWPKADRESIKAGFVVHPSNPTGYVYSEEELLQLARFYDPELAPNMIFLLDPVYHLLAPNRFKYLQQVAPHVPIITIDSLSKAQGKAGARVGGVVANRAADERYRRAGLLEQVIGKHKNALGLYAQIKGGAASHTTQSSPESQISAVITAVIDMLSGKIGRTIDALTVPRNQMISLYGIDPALGDGHCPYYLSINVFDYVRRSLSDKPEALREHVLRNLDVPEIVVRAVEKHLTKVFDAASFYPLGDMPNLLVASGYDEFYRSRLIGPPAATVRTAVRNVSPDKYVRAMVQFKALIDEQVNHLSSSYRGNTAVVGEAAGAIR